ARGQAAGQRGRPGFDEPRRGSAGACRSGRGKGDDAGGGVRPARRRRRSRQLGRCPADQVKAGRRCAVDALVLFFLYLLLAGLGDSPRHLVTLIDAEPYFQSRQIEISAEHLEQLAGTPPADAKGEVAQLLAIRWLGEHRTEAARGTLERIAQGQVGEDKYHFAQEYARRALAALDGQRPARPRTAENSLRQ